MSAERQKGTGFENDQLKKHILPVFPNASRAPQLGVNDAGDFINTRHWLFEAKKHNTWRIPTWIRQTAPKAERQNRPWALLFAGDRRVSGPLADDFALLPTRYLFRLLKAVYGSQIAEDGSYDPFEGLNDES